MITSDLLLSLQKPVRYIGAEFNSCMKDPSKIKVRFALAFPDVYEIGESNLAIKILYSILNSMGDVWAERVYVPWLDAEALFRKRSVPLSSLESGTRLCDFDLLGITLPSELCFTNILTLLDLGGIPLRSEDRDMTHPVVIGGGPCAANPEPLADFFDIFVLGDGEEVILEIVDLWLKVHSQVGERKELINELASIKGIYAPSLFRPEYNKDNTIKEIIPFDKSMDRISRRLVEGLDNIPYPESQIISSTAAIHDRIALEIARGCTRGCRFCHAGMINRPSRERSLERIKYLAEKLIASTGLEDVSLLSLSSGDYSRLSDLLSLLRQIESDEASPLVFSLPSLRPDGLPGEVLERIREGRKPGFTIAPEAGSERLRRVINKNISEGDILRMAEQLYLAGWDMIKLYFMIGLPSETETDILEIERLIIEMSRIGKMVLKKGPRFNITISPFVPKAHTPFQWFPQERTGVLEEKVRCLKDRLYRSVRDKIEMKAHNPHQALIEASLAQGDRRLATLIERAWYEGARFDQWGESFDPSCWERAFEQSGIDPSFYANRGRALDEVMPWSHIDMGVSEAFLKREYWRSVNAEQTPDCRASECNGCGACPPLMIQKVQGIWAGAREPDMDAKQGRISHLKRPQLGLGEVKERVRFKFTKLGKAACLSHLDLLRQFVLAMRRAGLPLAYSQGFHPSPKLSFCPALPVGIEGRGEYLDISLTDTIDPAIAMERINDQLPVGLKLIHSESVSLKSGHVTALIDEAHYSIYLPDSLSARVGDVESHKERIKGIIGSMEMLPVVRKGKSGTQEIDIRPLISMIDIKEGEGGVTLLLGLKMTMDKSVRPFEVLEAVYGDIVNDYKHNIRIVRDGFSLKGQRD